jgi:hypothetical protein
MLGILTTTLLCPCVCASFSLYSSKTAQINIKKFVNFSQRVRVVIKRETMFGKMQKLFVEL